MDPNGLELIGCHRDLKPQNILIDKGKLLLADFGLSRIHPDNSKSDFKEGMGDYMAPECELDGLQFNKGTISRPSDIWSLGCVVMEILTYHGSGREAIVRFVNQRRRNNTHEFGGVRYSAPKFHSLGRESPAVSEWLQLLKRDDSTARARRVASFCPLLERMLQIPPETRPEALDVAFELFFRAQQAIYEELNAIFEHLRSLSSSFELKIEHERFLAWGWGSLLLPADAQGFAQASPPGSSWMKKSPNLPADINRELSLTHSELITLKGLDPKQDRTWPVYKMLRGRVDKLWELQRQVEPIETEQVPLSEQMRLMVERKMLNSEDREQLKTTWKDLDRDRYPNILRLVAWKYMSAQLENDKRDKNDKSAKLLFLDENVETVLVRETHCFGTVPKSKKQQGGETVLVEYMGYLSGEKERHWKLLQLRAKKLATLLSGRLEDPPDGFRILRCIGYFHDPYHCAFGLMYAFPKEYGSEEKPLTLKEVIRAFARPELGTLFVLASALAQCILAFHKAGWLHKNISAHNMLFFDSQLARLLPNGIEDAQERGRDRNPVPRNACAEPSVVPAAPLPSPTPSPQPPSESAPVKKSIFKRMLSRSRPRRSEERGHHQQATSLAPPLPSTGQLSPSTSQPSERAASSVSLVSHHEKPSPAVPEGVLKRPYVVGFNHTRENDTGALTSTASRDPPQQLYQHPSYLGKHASQSFQPQYDWYSLGVVLLETGLWQTAEEMAPGLTGQEARTCWLTQYLPRLGTTMGSTYQNAVRLCLGCSPGDNDANIGEPVVRGLMRCYA